MTEAMSFSVALLAASTVCLLLAFLTKRQRYRLPPGPRGLPILGNIFNAPQEHEWRTFQEWGRKYGTCYRLPLVACLLTAFLRLGCPLLRDYGDSLCGAELREGYCGSIRKAVKSVL